MMTAKLQAAIKVFPDLKDKKPLEAYRLMTDKGYIWDRSSGEWKNETETQDENIIQINLNSINELADDALEIIASALEEYGFEVIHQSQRPYPSNDYETDKSGRQIQKKSKTHSRSSITVKFPDDLSAISAKE